MEQDVFLGDSPVRIVAIGAGNRTNKYLEYVRMHPDRLQLVGVVEVNANRMQRIAEEFKLDSNHCFADYNDFFAHPLPADAVLIATPENLHYDPCIKAIEAGYHVLLEKPIAQTLEECNDIAVRAQRKGVLVGVCHVLRYHPYFMKIKEIVDSDELGAVISINHTASVGLDRSLHGFVRGLWSKEENTNPMLIAKCCHDIDLLLWLTRTPCKRLTSFGSLRWFRSENAPMNSSDRCINCHIEAKCPYSAVDLYYNRRDWISNFDIPEGRTLNEVLLEELRHGRYGRCVFHCDNDVVDHQILSMEMESGVTVNFSMDIFASDDCRETHVKLTHGEIDGNEVRLRVRKFRDNEERVFDFSHISKKPFHAGADLKLVDDFVKALSCKEHKLRTSIENSVESHRICYEAERSRLTGKTIELGSYS